MGRGAALHCRRGRASLPNPHAEAPPQGPPGRLPRQGPIHGQSPQHHPRPWRARAQPEERGSRDPARRPRRVHGAVGLGQVLARLRHDLCRRPAPLRGEPVGLRAAISRDDAEAGRRPHRRPVARHLHRAEDDVEEPALDRRHRHRDLRLPAPAVCARRRALFARNRPADREPDRVADGRPRAGAARGHAHLPAGPHRARAEGRVQEGARRVPEKGLPARQGRRRVLRDRGRAQARQEVQARHRRGGGSARDPGRHRNAARGQLRDRARAVGRHRGRRARRQAAARIRDQGRQQVEERYARARHLFGALRLPRVGLHHRRDRAAPVLVQRPGRRLPHLRRARHGIAVRARPRRARCLAQPFRRRDLSVGAHRRVLALLRADADRTRQALQGRDDDAVGKAAQARAARPALRLR